MHQLILFYSLNSHAHSCCKQSLHFYWCDMQLTDVEIIYCYTAVDINYYCSTAADLKNFENIVHSAYCICFEILCYFNIQTAAAEYFSKLLWITVLKIIDLVVQLTAETVETVKKLGIFIDNIDGSTIVKWVKDIVKIYQNRK